MLQLVLVTVIAPIQSAGPFAGDARLEKVISYRADVQSVAAVCRAISEQTGVPLEVRPSLQEDLVVICFKDRPAREVLSVLAGHFGWEWIKESQGYRLIQSEFAQREEKRLLEEAIVRPYLEAQKAARKIVADARSVDQEKQRERLKELWKELDRLWESEPPEGLSRADTLLREATHLEAVTDPFKVFGAAAYASLSRERFLELDRRSRLVFSYRPTAAQLPLPGEAVGAAERLVKQLVELQAEHAAEVARTSAAPKPPRVPEEGGEEEMPRLPGGINRPFTAEEVATVRYVVSSGGGWFRQRIGWDHMESKVEVISTSGEVLASRHVVLPWSWREDMSLSGEAPRKDEQEAELPQGLPEALLRPLESEALKKVASTLRWEEEFFIAFYGMFAEKADPLEFLGKIYNEVAEAAGVMLVADMYDSCVSAKITPGGKTGAEIISSLTRGHSTWKFEDGWVRVRANDWALERATTAPRSVLTPFRESYLAQAGFTLEQAAALCSKLTDKQLGSPIVALMISLSSSVWWVSADLATAYGLRAFHALSPSEKLTLLNRGSLRYGSMTALARGPLAEFLYRSGNETMMSGLLAAQIFEDELWGTEEPGEAGEPEGEVEGAAPPDREITQILPFGPGPETTLTLEVKEAEGLAVMVEGGGFEFPLALSVGMFAAYKSFGDEDAERAGFSIGKFRPSKISRYTFAVEVAPKDSRKFAVQASVAAPGTSYGEYDALPKGLRDRIQKVISKMKGESGGGGDPPLAR